MISLFAVCLLSSVAQAQPERIGTLSQDLETIGRKDCLYDGDLKNMKTNNGTALKYQRTGCAVYLSEKTGNLSMLIDERFLKSLPSKEDVDPERETSKEPKIELAALRKRVVKIKDALGLQDWKQGIVAKRAVSRFGSIPAGKGTIVFSYFQADQERCFPIRNELFVGFSTRDEKVVFFKLVKNVKSASAKPVHEETAIKETILDDVKKSTMPQQSTSLLRFGFGSFVSSKEFAHAWPDKDVQANPAWLVFGPQGVSWVVDDTSGKIVYSLY